MKYQRKSAKRGFKQGSFRFALPESSIVEFICLSRKEFTERVDCISTQLFGIDLESMKKINCHFKIVPAPFRTKPRTIGCSR